MSNDRITLTAIVSAIALLVTNLYWWRRERTVQESLTVSRDRQATSHGFGEEVRAAAELLDGAPGTLATDIEALQEKIERQERTIAEHATELGNVRARWAEAFWDELAANVVSDEEPCVLTVELPHNDRKDAEALGKRAAEHDWVVVVIAANGDYTFVVTVGEELTGAFAADDIAREFAEAVGGGGAGGSNAFASGGVSEPVGPALEDLGRRLRAREPFVD